MPLCSSTWDLVPRNDVKWNAIMMDPESRDHEPL